VRQFDRKLSSKAAIAAVFASVSQPRSGSKIPLRYYRLGRGERFKSSTHDGQPFAEIISGLKRLSQLFPRRS
jgi:hypothetical protein